MDMKYLSDGRKVAIIGQLNNVETIVQEIFVTDSGDEIPSGERFVTKSLHDAPVKSWKDKEEDELKKRLNVLKREIKSAQLDHIRVKESIKAYSAILQNNKKLSELLPENDLKLMSMFVTGNIEYLVIKGYQVEKPVKLIDKMIDWERRYGEIRFDSIKLMSVMGRSGGDIGYRVHQYSDGSGSSHEVYPCETYDDAIEMTKKYAVERIEKGYFSLREYEVCKEIGIQFDPEILGKAKSILKESINKNLESANKEAARRQKNIDDYNLKLKEIDGLK